MKANGKLLRRFSGRTQMGQSEKSRECGIQDFPWK